jgi:hypothetical protein
MSAVLLIDLNMKALVRVDDLYRDTSTFVKSIQKGQGTASPYNDCVVYIKVKIEVDGDIKYCSPNFEELEVWEEGIDCLRYDLEEYTIPSVLRRVLKKTKLKEIVEVKTTKIDKLNDHFDDEVFSKSYFS